MYKKTALGLPLRMDWPPPTWVCASHRLVSYGSRSAAGIMGGVYSPGIPLALLKRARESALQTRIQILCLSRTYVHIYTMRRGLTINPFPESPSPPPTPPPPPLPVHPPQEIPLTKKIPFICLLFFVPVLFTYWLGTFRKLSPGVSIYLSMRVGGEGGVEGFFLGAGEGKY
jgi:hypothetical protein